MWQAVVGALMNKMSSDNQQNNANADSMASGIGNVQSNMQNLDWNNAMQFPQYKGFGGF